MSNAPPIKQLLTCLLQINKKYSVRQEAGTPTWFMAYTIKGSGRFTHAQGEVITGPGDMILTRPNTPHDYGVAPRLLRWDMLWIHFIPPPHWFSLLQWPQEAPGLMRLRPPEPNMRRLIAKQLRQVHYLATRQTQKHELLAMNTLEKIFLECHFLGLRHEIKAMDPRIQKTVDFLNQHFSKSTSIASLAKLCGLSPSHFMYLFQEQTGDTVQHLSETLRVKHACYLLELSQQPVSQIAAECGFQDPLYFSKRFKRMTGTNPLAYRKKNARPPALVQDFPEGRRTVPVAELLLEQRARKRLETQQKKLLGKARAETRRTWRLILHEDFSDAHVADRWEFIGGHSEISDGELHRWGGATLLAHFRQPVSGDIRIEFDCRLNGDYLSDVSCFLGALPLANKARACESGYLFQYGGEGNTRNFIERPGRRLGLQEDSPLVRGRPYHVRAERCGSRLTLTVNGSIVMDVHDDDPLSGTDRTLIGLYGWRSDAWYRNIRIYQRSVPLMVDPMEMAERQINLGHYESARQLFQEIAGSSQDPARREQARKGIHHAELKMEWGNQLISAENHLRNLWPSVLIEQLHHQLKINADRCGIRDISPLQNLPVAILECSRNQIECLEALRGMPLQILGCSHNAILDLSPLQQLPLQKLYCNQNAIKSLEPLRGLPLVRLHCSNNFISSLEPLQGMNQTSLACAGNHITSLLPLQSMPLDFLDCEDNQLTSLEPFVENPPPVFFFDNDTLPLAELERAAKAWKRNPAHAHHARNADVLLAIRRQDFRKLRTIGQSFQGRDYLYVPKAMGWQEARRFCETAGGHLLTLTSQEEENFIKNMQSGKIADVWLGLVISQGRPIWISGESSAFTRLPAPPINDGCCFVAEKGWSVDPTEYSSTRLHFIVEWPGK